MISNHPQFLAALADHKKVCVRFYSKPDSGVLDRVCAPMDYGPGENPDGLNRYWLWDYAGEPGAKAIGLVPQQILDVRILGDGFNASEFLIEPAIATAAPRGGRRRRDRPGFMNPGRQGASEKSPPAPTEPGRIRS